MEDQLIHFNGVDVDSGAYIRAPMTLAELRRRIPAQIGAGRGRARALVDWANPDHLRETGWGYIVHEDEDPAVLIALQPLFTHRAAQVGEIKALTFTEADRLEGEEAIDAFFDRYGVPPGDVEPEGEALPYYLLILGSPQRIPFSFQAELDMTHATGRLAFDEVAAYGRYAQNLVAQELNPVRRPRRLALFGTDNGDRITGLTSSYLIPPLAEKIAAIKPTGWAVETVPPPQASKPNLLQLLSGADAPALLFTAGHGAVSKRRPLDLQGALICSEWKGGSLSPASYLSGADVRAEHDYRGSIPFFFACFSAGTPACDVFAAPGEQAHRWHEEPFVGGLPQALLAHQHGPLAVIAHIDQAFQYSFLWNDNILGIAHFAGTYFRLMSGARVGYAMESFRRRFAAALASISRARRRRESDPDADIKRWIGYQDARYYTVLGDPAVKLPVADTP